MKHTHTHSPRKEHHTYTLSHITHKHTPMCLPPNNSAINARSSNPSTLSPILPLLSSCCQSCVPGVPVLRVYMIIIKLGSTGFILVHAHSANIAHPVDINIDNINMLDNITHIHIFTLSNHGGTSLSIANLPASPSFLPRPPSSSLQPPTSHRLKSSTVTCFHHPIPSAS